jgi:4-amino-4-deoxy-L-arabinose transferase-like glycosyltransferase
MKKTEISRLTLYRYRFVIGYSLLGVFFLAFLFLLPLLSPGGISAEEMQSAADATSLNFDNFFSSNLFNLPYRLVQQYSIYLFGLSVYSIKLASILFGAATAFFLILLLNRWYRSNVALLASIFMTCSTAFLFSAGFGSPTIMYIFWPVVLLWLGSKILNEKKPHPVASVALVVCFGLSLYTPFFFHTLGVVALLALLHPHLRHSIKKLPEPLLVIAALSFLLAITPLALALFKNPDFLHSWLFLPTLDLGQLADNIGTALAPVLSFNSASPATIIFQPMFGLGVFVLVVVGAIQAHASLFAARNAAIVALLFAALALCAFNPESTMFIFLPFAILVASGFEHILEKWYSFFPYNPYARVAGIFPIALFSSLIIASGLFSYINGYNYTPVLANRFNADITIVNQNLKAGDALIVPEDSLAFYQNLATSKISVAATASDGAERYLSLGRPLNLNEIDPNVALNLKLDRILTSKISTNSDRLYIYSKI